MPSCRVQAENQIRSTESNHYINQVVNSSPEQRSRVWLTKDISPGKRILQSFDRIVVLRGVRDQAQSQILPGAIEDGLGSMRDIRQPQPGSK